MTGPEITMQTRLRRLRQLPAAELGPQDTVLLDADAGVYYGLEGPAGSIWTLLGQEPTFGELCAQLRQSYDIDEGSCEHDTKRFIQQLAENGLVEFV